MSLEKTKENCRIYTEVDYALDVLKPTNFSRLLNFKSRGQVEATCVKELIIVVVYVRTLLLSTGKREKVPRCP